jgi:hypothetical protein
MTLNFEDSLAEVEPKDLWQTKKMVHQRCVNRKEGDWFWIAIQLYGHMRTQKNDSSYSKNIICNTIKILKNAKITICTKITYQPMKLRQQTAALLFSVFTTHLSERLGGERWRIWKPHRCLLLLGCLAHTSQAYAREMQICGSQSLGEQQRVDCHRVSSNWFKRKRKAAHNHSLTDRYEMLPSQQCLEYNTVTHECAHQWC